MPAGDRVRERRRAAALARHYRDEEGLSIAEIARRLGRAGRQSRRTCMTQPAIRHARSRRATGECVAAAGRPPRRGTARATPTRIATAPRGALSYPRRSRRNSKGCSWVQWLTRIRKVKGTIACQESGGHAQVSGVRRRGTRVIWRKLDCLKPNLQKMKRRIRRKGTCYRRHALRRHSCRAVATFGAWSVAQ